MKCTRCEQALGERARAAICIFVLGDEYIYSYYCCEACGSYTVESYHDRFLGEDEITLLGPFSAEVGDRCVELVKACPRPSDKTCDCASHRALYHGVPRG